MQEILGRARRRRWSEAEKTEIVAESFRPGVSVSWVARRHGVSASQLFNWRKAARVESAAVAGFVLGGIAATAGPAAEFAARSARNAIAAGLAFVSVGLSFEKVSDTVNEIGCQ